MTCAGVYMPLCMCESLYLCRISKHYTIEVAQNYDFIESYYELSLAKNVFL